MKDLFNFADSIISNLGEKPAALKTASALTGDMNSMDLFLMRSGSSGMAPSKESLGKFAKELKAVINKFGLDSAKPIEDCWQAVGQGAFKDCDSLEVPLKSKDESVSLDDAITTALYDGLAAAIQGQENNGEPFMPLVTISGRSETSTDRQLKVLDADIVDNDLTIKFFALLPGVDSNL